jgi:Fe-S-cluster containining protein
VVRKEIELIAEHLELSTEELRRRYLRRVGVRTSIIEHSVTKDCIFLRKTPDGKQCTIYAVRPNQCRTWPFWPENLSSPNAWNTAALRCLGMNRGRQYSGDEIRRIKDSKQWWENPDDTADSSKK